MTNRRTDEDELRTIDVPAGLVAGLRSGRAPAGEVTVAAALAADRLGTQPRSLTFLAEVVRRGGVGYAVTLPEPLPTPEQAALAATWLGAADSVTERGPAYDETVARWLESVALVVAARRQAGAGRPG
ncbi:hypothetical protein [Micromonospora sp. HM5-17]|jgi:hypothetical protein|uniref:hypothetical protein n=1 Tax=Micromonospora sp. HM5-17 TaxID=2487710 RepID=UPI000F466A54|nr:hypothetical protein [Micromonospora sp. HM5-17]ROT32717.1 hypothetical protein EF879_05790 [Micromonospora sp. HM5-17]